MTARKLYAAVGARCKKIKGFPGAEGCAEHCQVNNRQVGVDYIADWRTPFFEGRDE